MQRHVKTIGILYIALSATASAALASTHEEVWQKTVPAAGITKLSVSNVNGAVSVQPWDRPEMHIQAKKRVRHSSRETAEKYARQIEIAVETKGDAVEVRTVMPGQQEDWGWVEWFFSLDWLFERRVREASVSYEISTPRRMDAKLVSTNGQVQIGAIEGRADLHTTNGAIHITLPENIRADLEASTTNGNVTSQLPLAVQGKISKQGMEGKINGGGPPLKLRTTNGSITIDKTAAREAALPSTAVASMPSDAASSGGPASVLHIQVWQHGEQQVKISVPLALAQGALRNLPDTARDHMRDQGVDIEELLQPGTSPCRGSCAPPAESSTENCACNCRCRPRGSPLSSSPIASLARRYRSGRRVAMTGPRP